MKRNKGITLVALVITIIILIILASVTFSMVLGQNGLIEKSKDGADRYKDEASREQNEINNVTAFIDSIVSGTGTTPSSNPSTPGTYAEYEIGDEVTVGTGANAQHFYVLEASGPTESTVTLLAKYNLNKAGTAQAPNASWEDTTCAFSSRNYWESVFETYTDWTTKILDINTVSGEVEGDEIYKAKQYATAQGGTGGRLLTAEEAFALFTSHSDMVFGKANQQGEGSSEYCLYYWLSSSNGLKDRIVYYKR